MQTIPKSPATDTLAASAVCDVPLARTGPNPASPEVLPASLTATAAVVSGEVLPAAEIRAEELRPDRRIAWSVVFWIALLHLGVLAAPFTFTWWAIPLALVLGWVTAGIGICLGYHRLFTHRGFATYRPLSWLIAWLGTLAGEGTLADWVADHRQHHAYSDREGDPHSPHDGPWWAHMLWLFWTEGREHRQSHRRRWVPDLVRDPGLQWIDRMFLASHFLLGLTLFAIGYWLGGYPAGITAVVWGMFVRLVYVLHTTWLVNSASHMWGYRNYQTRDDSRNLWWVALLSYGEGWHNNHHAYPRMARHGHRWWELDLTFGVIRLLRRVGLAWDVVDNQHLRAVSGQSGPAAAAEPGPA